MKHFKYGFGSRLYSSPALEQIMSFFRANIRTTYTFPKNIWYSLRYNAGEKFILKSSFMYPYNYDDRINEEQKQEPVRLSNRLIACVNEIQVEDYLKKNKLKDTIGKKTFKEIKDSYDSVFMELYKSFEFNIDKKNKIDVPVVVPARTLYAAAFYKKIHSDSENIEEETEKFPKIQTLSFILDKFLEKLEYADSESISQVMYTLTCYNYYSAEVWNQLINALKLKDFEPEFTSVYLDSPFIFRYKECRNEEERTKQFGEFGKSLFVDGYKPVYEAYHSLKLAASNKIETSEIIALLDKKFPILKKEYEKYSDWLI